MFRISTEKMRSSHLLAIVFILAFAGAALGQVAPPYPPPPYPPAQRPGRVPERPLVVQYISGEVSVAPKDTSDWSVARLNQSLRAGQYIWTGKDSRVEIAVGNGFVRM